MKLNWPLILVAGSVGLVGLMAVANAKTILYAENGCRRIVIKDPEALMASLDNPSPALEERMTEILNQGGSGEEAAGRLFDAIIADQLPQCPSPLPPEAVFYNQVEDTTVTFVEARGAFVTLFADIFDQAFASAGRSGGIGRRVSVGRSFVLATTR